MGQLPNETFIQADFCQMIHLLLRNWLTKETFFPGDYYPVLSKENILSKEAFVEGDFRLRKLLSSFVQERFFVQGKFLFLADF